MNATRIPALRLCVGGTRTFARGSMAARQDQLEKPDIDELTAKPKVGFPIEVGGQIFRSKHVEVDHGA